MCRQVSIDVRETLSVGDVVSYEDVVSAGRLLYTHDGSNTLQDGIHLTLRGGDGGGEGEALELKIMVVRGDFKPPQRDRDASWMTTVDAGTEKNLRKFFFFYSFNQDGNV